MYPLQFHFYESCYKIKSLLTTAFILKAVKGGESALAMAKRRYNAVAILKYATQINEHLNFGVLVKEFFEFKQPNKMHLYVSISTPWDICIIIKCAEMPNCTN